MNRSNARKIGTDVELFGHYVHEGLSAAWFADWMNVLTTIPSKGNRLNLGNGIWTHRDGLSAEYGFEPTTNVDQFMSMLDHGKRAVEDALSHELYPTTVFSVESIINEPWAEDMLNMGCSPDFLATDTLQMQRRSVPVFVRRQPQRECGGHIHVSLPEPYLTNRELCCQFVRELDEVVRPLATSDMAVTSRSWYRRRYVFRPTAYGIEYRTLGAGALFAPNAETFLSLVFDMSRRVWEL